MTSDVVVPAAETTAANGRVDAHSTAGFKALMLGSIGVVYGDIDAADQEGLEAGSRMYIAMAISRRRFRGGNYNITGHGIGGLKMLHAP